MQLRSCSYKPTPKFLGQGEYYLGVELEVEAPNYEARLAGLNASTRREFYAKRDGSLSANGWELISHPIARDLWLAKPGTQAAQDTTLVRQYKGQRIEIRRVAGGYEWSGTTFKSLTAVAKAVTGYKSINGRAFFSSSASNPAFELFELVRNLRRLGYDSHNGGRCGLHIHVCRKAFGATLHCPAFYWFQRLVNGPLFLQLSQRERMSYCQQRQVNDYDFFNPSISRYSAVNITRGTVEVRIFRGNTREERIRKGIEAVIAAIEFSKTLGKISVRSQETLENAFRQWVLANDETYTNLNSYLMVNATTEEN